MVIKQICHRTPCLSLTYRDRYHLSQALTGEVPSYLSAAPPAIPHIISHFKIHHMNGCSITHISRNTDLINIWMGSCVSACGED